MGNFFEVARKRIGIEERYESLEFPFIKTGMLWSV